MAKEEQGKKEATIPMGPDTVMKTLGRDQTEEPKKLKSSTAVEDDGVMKKGDWINRYLVVTVAPLQ